MLGQGGKDLRSCSTGGGGGVGGGKENPDFWSQRNRRRLRRLNCGARCSSGVEIDPAALKWRLLRGGCQWRQEQRGR